MAENATHILIVDDHEVVRAGLVALFSRASDLAVVGVAASAEEALPLLEQLEPDVIVLDYRLPGISGAIACAEILRRRPSTAVIVLTSAMDDGVLISCLSAGARGYLLKSAERSDLVEAVRVVAAGGSIVAPEALDNLLRWVRDAQPLRGNSNHLSPDEVAALSLAAQGRKNREIARLLKVNESSVRGYLNGARRKLGARERSEAVLAGIRRGVI